MKIHTAPRMAHRLNVLLPAVILLVSACSGSNGPDDTTPAPTPTPASIPADSYFSLAVTENSHNHTGARILLLDFVETAPATSAGANNVVISPRISNNSITADGDSTDWNNANLTTIKGLVQNNYPLSQFIDAVPTDITIGSAWDDEYLYFLVQWEDAGHTQSTQYRKWIYGDQGNGETGWTAKVHTGISSGSPNESAANASHVLAGSEDEDRVYLMFPVTDSENAFTANGLGCAAFCHANLGADNPFQNYTGTDVAMMHTNNSGDTADVWRWQSSRTEPASIADDLLLTYSSTGDSGFVPDTGNPTYTINALSSNNPASMHTSGLTYTGDVLLQADTTMFNGNPNNGDQIPAVITQTPDNSRADIISGASWDSASGRWTVEFRRLRNTGNADDKQFIPGTDVHPLTAPVITSTDTTAGSMLYGNLCEGCHGENGIGSLTGNSWQFPRIQRTSGSLILKAIQTVPAMSGINITHQAAEDIAAFLQGQSTFSATYRLDTIISGVTIPPAGTVTSSQPGINCPDTCDYNFLPGSSITLNANYIDGYTFSDWSGTSCNEGSQTGSACSFALNSGQNVTASYTPTIVNYTLTVSTETNGSVSSSPGGITCAPDCTAPFSENAAVTLTAIPDTGYRLDAWSGDCTGSAGCTVNMSADRNVTATFAQTQATVAPCEVNDPPPAIPDIAIQEIVSGLSAPVHVTHAGDGSGRLFIVEQRGTVRIAQNGALQAGNFLNIQDRVRNSGEMGLLSIAFHPDFSSNGRFFVNYVSDSSETNSQCTSSNRCTIVSEFTVGATATLEDSERIILEVTQPYGNHNGGQLAFGPETTPYLYIGMGDGGSGGDPDGYGQDLTTLLGGMLRIDVNNKDSGLEYAIPADNPTWAGVADARREIWAYGLRNPWRFSFDPVTDDLYAADVGQVMREEVNIIKKGLNYGWNEVEGDICFVTSCNLAAYEPPIIAPPRNEGWYSITGGMVYRGSDIPDLCGVYLYGDYVANYVRGLRYDGIDSYSEERSFSPTVNNLSSFGYDESYEVYALNRGSGRLYKIVAP
ncbi:MAG: PQQ-dependent sugar dehydrogenase [Gammaproteobacteria bacterium]|nr:PQQ-dependent sugar dehydrogenase [Gammaproteobacteria bacterium]MCF6261783.1 PQQ-dependent sugar dehydrogenase [Gammaproteobacteria bacterium]